MPATKIDLSSYLTDTAATISAALGYINDAQKSQKAAADKAAARISKILGVQASVAAKP